MAKLKKETSTLNAIREKFDRVADIIRPFFHAYDMNRDHRMDADELEVTWVRPSPGEAAPSP